MRLLAILVGPAKRLDSDYQRLCLPVPVPPTLLGSDDERLLSVPAKGHLTMECQADLDPPPDIEWYKDDVRLQVRLDVRVAGITIHGVI